MAMSVGFDDFKKIRSDPSLAPLQRDERFEKIMAKFDEPIINERARARTHTQTQSCHWLRPCGCAACAWLRTTGWRNRRARAQVLKAFGKLFGGKK